MTPFASTDPHALQPTCTRRAFLNLAGLGLSALMAPLALSGCGSSESAGEGSSQGSATASSANDKVRTTTLFVFDTVVTISAQCSAKLLKSVEDRCTYFENKFSRTVEGSDIWNINNAGGEPVEVAPETAAVIKDALGYAKASDGLFDITIGAVSSLWDFVEGVKPDDAAIQAALPHVDYRCVKVDGTTVTLTDPDAKLDLGGIAKGYITDDLVSMLREGGCKNASLSLGGNVYVMGKSFDGDAWNVGVQDPNGEQNDVIATVKACNRSLVTSGLYERSFEQDGTLYYHILDPKTGYPATTDLKSASIMTKSSVDGDAYSTILFLLGHDRAMELIENDERFEGGVLVDMDDNATKSAGSTFKLVKE